MDAISMIIEAIKAIFLGIVEGITEWLPISSTGHMILVDEFLQLNISPEFKEMFFVVIQLGAILAVVFLYFNKLNPFAGSKSETEKKDTWTLWLKVLAACVPAGIIGFLFDDILDKYFYNPWTVAVMLIIYGVFFILVENRNKEREPKIKTLNELDYKTAFLIGVFQILALIPGTSRSGATILGGILIGTSRYIAAEFTFFLGIPVMAGASLYKILKFAVHPVAVTSTEIMVLIVGTVVAFIVSIIAIKFLMGYIKKHDFKAFGWYRIVLGIIVLAYFLIKLAVK